MAKTNTAVKATPIYTHEGAKAAHITALQQLRRSVCSCLLWEDEFYEDGVTIAKRIAALVHVCKPADVAALAIEARESYKLRHVPLLLVRELARHPKITDHPKLVSSTLATVIQRADELAEFVAIYWKEKKQPLSKQVKRGLAWAFHKFDEYQLAKYDREGKVSLRDVLFLSHAKPKDDAEAALFKRIAQNELKTPDTWEVALSAGADKQETFGRLIQEKQLGGLALLRNLRNMQEAGLSADIIRQGINLMDTRRILPFRFLTAAKYGTQFEPELEQALFRATAALPKLKGKTAILVDKSGSMQVTVSAKSDVSRFEAGAALAVIAREQTEVCRVFVFSTTCVEVPPRRGFGLMAAMNDAMGSGGTNTADAIKYVYKHFPECERLIVVTDEQSHQSISKPQGTGYVINVASAKNGIGYGKWVHIDGWSEAALKFIQEYEGSTE